MRRFFLALVLAVGACGGDAAIEPQGSPASIEVVAGDGQTAVTGMPLANEVGVEVRDAAGRPLPGLSVEFEVTGGGGFVLPRAGVTDASGRAWTRWYVGSRTRETQRLVARAGTNLGAMFTATALPAELGITYLGRGSYMEYRAGTLPIIISAPHGGSLLPGEIPDRTYGTVDRDTNTEELAREIAAALERIVGERPHVVISRLHRRKLDPNREIVEAAQGNAYAEHAWQEWNTFLAAARETVSGRGAGLYIDLHGHGHAIARLELGYMLTGSELALPAATLGGANYVQKSSIRSLVQRSGRSLPELLTGASAFGTLLENAGVPAVPSAQQPHPGSDPYFNGGYNTQQYGSRNGGVVDGIQIETHFNGIRNTSDARAAFANKLVAVLQQYFATNYGTTL